MYNIDFFKVGQKMKELRTQKGISQRAVARSIDSTVAYVSNIENNKVKINLRMLLYYAEMCNVSVDVFIDAGREESLYPGDCVIDNQILDALKSFDYEEKEKILKILRLVKNDNSAPSL